MILWKLACPQFIVLKFEFPLIRDRGKNIVAFAMELCSLAGVK